MKSTQTPDSCVVMKLGLKFGHIKNNASNFKIRMLGFLHLLKLVQYTLMLLSSKSTEV